MKTYQGQGLQISSAFKEPTHMVDYDFGPCVLHHEKIHYLHVRAKEGRPREYKI